MLEYAKTRDSSHEESLLGCAAQLFATIASCTRSGYLGPRSFISRLRVENEMFRSSAQQDAHEFLIYLLNSIAEAHEKEMKRKSLTSKTFVREIFEGTLTNETKCLCCENITSKDESFLDLSIDIEQNSSLTGCLKKFSATETLEKQNKFFCEYCCSLQEAQKRMKIKALPQVLIIHLKRFKYVDLDYGGGSRDSSSGRASGIRFMKLSHRVVFPLELRLSHAAALSSVNPEQVYHLFSVVIHIGSGPNQGHYISVIKSQSGWQVFDDQSVHPIKESQISSIFGSPYPNPSTASSQTGYILFYTT